MAAAAASQSDVAEAVFRKAQESTGKLRVVFESWSSLDQTFMTSTKSPVLVAAGIKWLIAVYPTNDRDENKDYVAVYLTNKSGAKVNASFTLRIVNQRPGGAHSELKSTVWKLAASGLNSSRGFARAILRSRLENETNGFKVNDHVVVECDITVFGEPPAVEVVPAAAAATRAGVAGSTLQQDLLKLLGNAGTADVTVKVQGSTFSAHSQILGARSSVFEAMLAGGMAEAETRTVTVPDVEPGVFDKLLRFVYTDEVDTEGDGVEALLVAADKYDVRRLVQLCEAALVGSTSVANVADRLVMADMHGASTARLREHCVVFAARHAAEVMATEGFRERLAREASLVTEVLAETTGTRKRPRDEDDGAAGGALTVEGVRELRVEDLKRELQNRGLATTGRKAALQSRLRDALNAAAPVP